MTDEKYETLIRHRQFQRQMCDINYEVSIGLYVEY